MALSKIWNNKISEGMSKINNKVCYIVGSCKDFCDKIFFPLKEEDIIKSDKQSQVSYLTTLCEKGILTVNEVRKQLGYSPVEGGDELKALYTDVQQNTVGNKDENNENSLYKNNENKENEEQWFRN